MLLLPLGELHLLGVPEALGRQDHGRILDLHVIASGATASDQAPDLALEAGAAAKKALDDSGYQFGDLTKGAIKGFEETIRDATGNDECESLLSAFASLAAALLRCCRRSPFSASVLRLILMLITVCATLACQPLPANRQVR